MDHNEAAISVKLCLETSLYLVHPSRPDVVVVTVLVPYDVSWRHRGVASRFVRLDDVTGSCCSHSADLHYNNNVSLFWRPAPITRCWRDTVITDVCLSDIHLLLILVWTRDQIKTKLWCHWLQIFIVIVLVVIFAVFLDQKFKGQGRYRGPTVVCISTECTLFF